MSNPTGSIAFAERLMALLDQGKFTATYKYAVLLGLMDIVLENSSRALQEPFKITTKQLAYKVIEFYWPHAVPFTRNNEVAVLKQNNGTQAKIISLIQRARDKSTLGSSAPYFKLKTTANTRFEKLVNDVEWVLIEMPLPRLQRVGSSEIRFIYDIDWDRSVKAGTVRAYQSQGYSEFNNCITLMPGVASHFISLSGLLRPVIQQQWAMHVALLNNLEAGTLNGFLFGQQRVDLTGLTSGLREIQSDRCFYCHSKIGQSEKDKPEVDHFIPWARVPSNDMFNFVIAHRHCNASKKDFLASSEHLQHWIERAHPDKSIHQDLLSLAESKDWIAEPNSVQSIVDSTYQRLMPEAELWQLGQQFESADLDKISSILRSV